MQTAQTRQGIHHGLFAAHEVCSTRVCTELAMTAEPSHHDGSSEAQHNVQHDGGDPVAHARTGVFFVVFTQEAVNGIAHDTR